MNDRLLNQLDGVAIFHRDVARRAGKVGLLEAGVYGRLVVVGIGKEGRDQFHSRRTLGNYLANRETVGDLLDHQHRENGLYGRGRVDEWIRLSLQQRRVSEGKGLLVGADLLLRIGADLLFLRPLARIDNVVAAAGIHRKSALLGDARDAEGGVEKVQQAAVIGIAHVLGVQLPIGVDELTRVAERAN